MLFNKSVYQSTNTFAGMPQTQNTTNNRDQTKTNSAHANNLLKDNAELDYCFSLHCAV